MTPRKLARREKLWWQCPKHPNEKRVQVIYVRKVGMMRPNHLYVEFPDGEVALATYDELHDEEVQRVFN